MKWNIYVNDTMWAQECKLYCTQGLNHLQLVFSTFIGVVKIKVSWVTERAILAAIFASKFDWKNDCGHLCHIRLCVQQSTDLYQKNLLCNNLLSAYLENSVTCWGSNDSDCVGKTIAKNSSHAIVGTKPKFHQILL